MFVVVDASVWVSRLVEGDEFHIPVKGWMNSQREQDATFVSPSLLLAEVGGVISRVTGKPELGLNAIQKIENLPDVRIVDMDKALMDDASRIAAKYGLRGADSVYVAVASTLKIPLVTFDVDQRERGSKLVDVIEIPVE
ncbi:MAG TPA: type II toxin-antitoxin system VapC family toxin [Anaerolineales bacterium]|nr:type II toxin-antitoxin system VapC family toxin [Anaerolineales bacterium]